MDRIDRQQLKALVHEVTPLVEQARAIDEHRTNVSAAVAESLEVLRQHVIDVPHDGQVAWRVVPVSSQDASLVARLHERAALPHVGEGGRSILSMLTGDATVAIQDARSGFGLLSVFRGEDKRARTQMAGAYLSQLAGYARSARLRERLAEMGDSQPRIDRGSGSVDEILRPEFGLASDLAALGARPVLLPERRLAALPKACERIARAVAAESVYRRAAETAANALREAEVWTLLQDMPTERLKQATNDRIPIKPLAEAGIQTVAQVLSHGPALHTLPGLGATTAARIRGAAQTLRQTALEEMPPRLDIVARRPEATALLRALASWDAVRGIKGAERDLQHAAELAPMARVLATGVSHVLVLTVAGRSPDLLLAGVDTVVQRARLLAGSEGEGTGLAPRDPWEDFIARAADYFALLSELGFLVEDEKKVHGDLPDQIVTAIREQPLNTEHMNASLRGYQGFAARFALVQGKVIIGDEMGLGKTVEALAVLAHLRSDGAHYFLVICPAAVVTNWVREVSGKSRLRAYRLHGSERDAAAKGWVRHGGVAVTTYETLGWLTTHVKPLPVACVIVDEAHYIKNPEAQRSLRTSQIIRECERAVLLTGTPLENRVEEFRNLVRYVRPDVLVDATDLAPRRFRKQVAPAYLRRNQEDVLAELPELVEVDEWLPMSSRDDVSYRDAVRAGNFMAMRQAALINGRDSQKIVRLLEIVGEAEDNGRRVIVFSYFRSVLDGLIRLLPGEVFGPLNGSVPAASRQTMVDGFSQAGHGAVLLSQIAAGGVGLNIQAASVVIICEPQLKPTTEAQAVARAHRMGQVNTVQVHRLLSEEGVDQRITEILATKSRIFEDFARESETAGSAPEAFDVSEGDLAKQVLAEERERLFSTPVP